MNGGEWIGLDCAYHCEMIAGVMLGEWNSRWRDRSRQMAVLRRRREDCRLQRAARVVERKQAASC